MVRERPLPSGKTQYHPNEVEIINQHKSTKFEQGLSAMKSQLDQIYTNSPLRYVEYQKGDKFVKKCFCVECERERLIYGCRNSPF